MTEFKVGDRVKAIGQSEMGFTDQIGKVGEIVARTAAGMLVVNWDGKPHQNNMPPSSLEHVTKRPVARILTEKILVNGVKCRRITGFDGILMKDELPKKYTDGSPAFWQYSTGIRGAHVFDGERMGWTYPDGSNCRLCLELPDGVKINVGGWEFAGMSVGDVWPESTYQELLTWLKRAGSRLAKIRQQEREAWSGAGADEI